MSESPHDFLKLPSAHPNGFGFERLTGIRRTRHAKTCSAPTPGNSGCRQTLPTQSRRRERRGPAIRGRTPVLRLNTSTGLTAEHWNATVILEPRSFEFNDKKLRNRDMDRLAALEPEEVRPR